MRLMKASVLVAVAAVLLTTNSCKHEPDLAPEDPFVFTDTGYVDTSGPAPYIDPCDPDTVYFVQDILPLIISNCTGVGSGSSGCHNAAHHAEGVRLYDYLHIMQQVTPGNPNQSDLLTDGIWQNGEDQMPPDGPMPDSLVQLIVTWIQQGALNNSCVGGCDTNNVTYNGTIRPLLTSKCAGSSCHDASSPANNMDLTNYAGAYSIANDGSLAGSIQHQTDYTAMPPNQWLSQCEIDQILIWIQDGAPNN